MVHVYYHYNNGLSKRGSHCRTFPTRKAAERWIDYMSSKYPKFQMDEVFTAC